MSYVDAHLDTKHNLLRVVERTGGERVYRDLPAHYDFYVESPQGEYKSVWNRKLRRESYTNFRDFKNAVERENARRLYEADANVTTQLLSEYYKDAEHPDLHISFFDIEVDFDPELGFSEPDDPYAPINAISVYNQWNDFLVTVAVPHLTFKTEGYYADGMCEVDWRHEKGLPLTFADYQKLVNDEAERRKNNLLLVEEGKAEFDENEIAPYDTLHNIILVENELQLLELIPKIMEDADIISGYNSDAYDVPYIINRTKRTLGEHATKRYCLWGKYPTPRTFIRFDKECQTYDFSGRVHLDYQQLYQKFLLKQIHSTKLDYVGEMEVGEKKIPYEGTLDRLYKDDFLKFLLYNRQDTLLLDKIDKKKRYIQLANTVAHNNGVLLPATLGTVQLIEQAILNEAHERDMRFFNKRNFESTGKAAGAFVADPKVGLTDWIAACDVNSLYPSVIRALNMSPETLIGQIRPDRTMAEVDRRIHEEGMEAADAWHGFFGTYEYQDVIERTERLLTVDFEDNGKIIKTVQLTGAQLHDMIFAADSQIIISGNGTLFRKDIEGIIPGILRKWYEGRVEMKNKMKDLYKVLDKASDPDEKKKIKDQIAFWDQRQGAVKVMLNSLYGSILNKHSRYYDPRIGQSTTLSGRCVTKHMTSEINRLITGDYNYQGKSITYGDTDSYSSDTIHRTNWGNLTVEQLFNLCNKFWTEKNTGKEYAFHEDLKVLSFDPNKNQAYFGNINYIYRHKVKKEKWEIEDEYGNVVRVTGDHSIMIERDGILMNVKPHELIETDFLISANEYIIYNDRAVYYDRNTQKRNTN